MTQRRKTTKSKWVIFIFTLISMTFGQLLFSDQTITLRAPEYTTVLTPEGFHRVILKGFYSYGIPGYPDLPSKIYRIAIPPHADLRTVNMEIEEAESVYLGYFNIQELPVMATWADGQEIIADKADIYSNNAYYPERSVEFLGTSQMRKWRIVNIKYNPFQYNPVTKDLRFISNVIINVKYASRGEGFVSDWELSDTVMEERAQKILLNYSDSKIWYTPSAPVQKPSQTHNYVIITTNSIVSSSTKLTDFTNYLTSKGYSPLVITEDDYGILTGQSPNGTAEKIRQWLINNYISYSIEYVLLIGNPDPAGDVPMKMCWPRYSESTYRESPTDYFYADLTGNWDLDGDGYFGEYPSDGGTGGVDFTNEVYVGRIPVYSSIANLDSVLTKTMNYGNASNITWRKNALLPMSYSDATTDGAYLSEYMKSDYLSPAGISSWTLYMQGNVCLGADSSFTSNEELLDGATETRWVSNPYGLVWWWGHGSSTTAYLGYDACGWGTIMSTSGSSSLNDNYPSFVYQCSCTNGYPESSSNLGTALLYNGAITTTCASRVSWYAVTLWSPSLKYYCDNASIGYYYGKELVSSSKKAAVALYDVKNDMGANHFTSWGGCHWMNLFDFNLYGNPVTSLNDQILGTVGYYVLDGLGGVHAGGTAATFSSYTPYFGWDIARDMELNASGNGYYVLDGYGGIHTGGAAAIFSSYTPYFGWDIARDMELNASGNGYYVLDGYGGIHTGGAASILTPASPYFGWDIAGDMELNASGNGYYVLDGYGGIHTGGAASTLTSPTPYFGWDIAKDLEFASF